jgi:hypothetical protein
MKMRILLLAFCLNAGVHAVDEEMRMKTGVTPIQKVLELMEEMRSKAIKDKKDEEVRFSAFSQWCADTKRTKTDEINAGNQRIESLNAEIEKARVHIEQLTARILELEEDVGRWKKDEKSASTVRDAERADFVATNTDYSESINALQQAISVLKKQDYSRSQAELLQSSLLQVHNSKLVPMASKKALAAFLQQDPYKENMNPLLDYQAPEAGAYEFQSGGVLDMLEKLLVKFSTQRTQLQKDDLGNQQAYEQMMQQLADNIENAEFEINKKTKFRAETQQTKAEKEGDLAQTTADRDEDQKYLDDTVALCKQKADDFASRQSLRAGEIESLNKAIEIISSQTVRGTGEKYLPSLVQVQKKGGRSLAQLRSDSKNPMQQKMIAFLNERAHKTGSRVLSEIAAAAEGNPFGKVLKMIQQLIFRLQEEATAETEHQGWCQTELTTNKQTRGRKTAEIAELNTLIEDLTATIAELTQDIADAEAAIKELDAAMAKETSERQEAKAANEETIKSAKEAVVAVEEAIAVLKDFYSKSAEATAFSQQPAVDAPETFDKPYKGLLPEGGSVIDFLQVIRSDFERLGADTATSEAEEEDQYKTFMFESKKDKALKENEIALKSQTKTEKESALQQANTDLKTTQEQLDAALKYYEELKPSCVDSGITYEERVKRREEEIVSLQEALKILKGTDLPTMGSGTDLPN